LHALRLRVHAPRVRRQPRAADARERERPAGFVVLAVRDRAAQRVAVQLQPDDVVAAAAGGADVPVVRPGRELRLARQVDEADDVPGLALLAAELRAGRAGGEAEDRRLLRDRDRAGAAGRDAPAAEDRVRCGRSVKRRAAARQEGDGREESYAPWHFLNFLPEPHQHGSLRPILSCSVARTVCGAVVAVAPPPPNAVAVAVAPPSAAVIASAPCSVSCAYWRFPFCARCCSSRIAASAGAISAWKSVNTTSSRMPCPSSSNSLWPSPRYSTSGSFCANERRWMPSRM